MPDFNSAEYQAALTKQFSDSLQATAALTQSVKNLHEEVRQHSELLILLKSEIISSQARLTELARLVQGEGFQDSISSTLIELRTKVVAIEKWKDEYREDSRSGKQTNVTVIVLIVSAVSTLVATGLAILVPMLLK